MKNTHQNKNHFEEQFEDSEANFSEANNNMETGDRGRKQGEPIQLIKIRPTGKIEINQEALDIIASSDLPVGFVSLVGKSRTGKSFLLNKLLHLSGEGFRVDSSTKACTEGIWMWSEPVYNENLGNYIFFLDTQGTDSLVKDAENDTKIFTLATLISSYFIYNSVGAIDERSLSEIQMITALSKQIKADEKMSDRDNQQNLYQYMPKFLWILRDFTLRLEDQKGRKITSTQYLNNCLTDQSSIGRVNQDSRKIKKSIMTYFKNRQCLVLVRPAGDQFDIQRLNSIPEHALRRQFIEGVNSLRQKILKNAGPKTYQGQQINGGAISSMIESYVEAFNSGKTPSIKTAWQQISQDQGASAYNKALDKYQELFKQSFPNDEPKGAEIHKILRNIREDTIHQFQSNVDQRNDQYMKKLKDLLDEKEEEVLRINEQMNQVRNNQILMNHAQKLKLKIEGNKYANNKEELQSDIKEIERNYNRDAKGEKKGQIITQFLSNLTPIILNIEKNDKGPGDAAKTQVQVNQLKRMLDLKDQQNQTIKKRLQAEKNAVNIKNGQLKAGSKQGIKGKGKQDEKKKGTGCCGGGSCQIM